MKLAFLLGGSCILCAFAACSSAEGGAKPVKDAGARDAETSEDAGENDARTPRDSGRDTGSNDHDAETDADVEPDADEPDVVTPAPTWTQIYNGYFAPGTPGHCASFSCHGGDEIVHFSCTSKTDCYNSLVDQSMIDTVTPSASAIIDPSASNLWWFNPAANPGMPRDNSSPNATAAADIQAWVLDGAENN